MNFYACICILFVEKQSEHHGVKACRETGCAQYQVIPLMNIKTKILLQRINMVYTTWLNWSIMGQTDAKCLLMYCNEKDTSPKVFNPNLRMNKNRQNKSRQRSFCKTISL